MAPTTRLHYPIQAPITNEATTKEPPFSGQFSPYPSKQDFCPSTLSHEPLAAGTTEEKPVTTSEEDCTRNEWNTTDLCTIHIDYEYWSYSILRPSTDLQTFLRKELDVSRLNNVYNMLWWAGRQVPARPLHRLQMLGRNILITEQMDLHLTWSSNLYYVKPLPNFLLDSSFWEKNICRHEHSWDVYESAHGFILSYIWLVRHRSDFEIAKEKWLLPADLTWPMWKRFVESVLDSFGDLNNPRSVSKRYKYGELRVSRLDQIYRFTPKFFPCHLLRGYLYSYSSFGSFFRREFAWLIVAFAFVSTILSALQVGLTTTQLKDNDSFHRASYGFTVVSLMFPAIASLIVIVLYSGLWVYHFMCTLSSRRQESI